MSGADLQATNPQETSPARPAGSGNASLAATAQVAGAVVELPSDLYIPPNALAVCLDTFEGPLDLLLYLVRRRNIDILEIDVAEITDQYVAYIELMQASQFELAAEYMVMAATLAEIKSRILLPRPEPEEAGEEADPRSELVRQLLEYERYKLAAEQLDELPRIDRELRQALAGLPDRRYERPQPAVQLSDLLEALAAALRQAELFEHHHVRGESISTEDKISHLLANLDRERFLPLVAMFDAREGRLGVVVTFLAVMELMRKALVEIVQPDGFGPIHLRLAGPGESA